MMDLPYRPNCVRSARLVLAWLALGVSTAAAASPQAPSFQLLDSYFPSWLIGAGVAIPVVLGLRYALIRTGIDDTLPWRLLVYVCLGALFTMAFAYYFSPR